MINEEQALSVLPSEENLEIAEGKMLEGIQPVTFLKHHFAPGVYMREIWMPKGSIILGHRHNTEHFNIISQGSALVRMEGRMERIIAPYTVKSGVGVRKALFIIEDMVWTTVHANPDDETNIEILEHRLAIKSDTFKRHEAKQAQREFEAVMKNIK